MRGKLIIAALIVVILLSLLGYSSKDSSKPTEFLDTGIAENETNAFDSSLSTYAYLNTSTGNNTYLTFTVDTHNNTEDVKQVDVAFDIEVTGTADDAWALQYSDDGGSSWNDLRSLATGDQARTVLNYSDIQESSDNDWTWDEMRNDLQLRIQTEQNAGLDSASIRIYDIYVNVTFDDQGPKITLTSPVHTANFTQTSVNFSYNPDDELSNVTNCSLMIDGAFNLSNSTIFENIANNFTQTFPEGAYNWTVRCFDNSTTFNQNSSLQRQFTVDLTEPTIVLESPADLAIYNVSNNVVFNYNVSDTSQILNCSVYINDTLNDTDYSVLRETSQSFTVTMANGNYTWTINCTDGRGFTNASGTRTVDVQVNEPPNVDSVFINNVTLTPGLQTNVTCNATVSDPDGEPDISGITATLVHSSSNLAYPDENSTHYTNSSCTETGSTAFTRTYSCGFYMWYFGKHGTWSCHVNVSDNPGATDADSTTFDVGSLYALNVSPQRIDYGVLLAGNTSQNDVEILVYNFGNRELDITLDGYAVFDGDGLAMNCTLGDINLSYERYSLTSGVAFDSMVPLTDDPVQLDTFNLIPENDTFAANKTVYWKIHVPKPQKGDCDGFVTFSAVTS